MSSNLRTFSQIPVRTKYLITVRQYIYEGGATGGDLFGNDGAAIVRVRDGTINGLGSVATTTQITEYANRVGVDLGAYDGVGVGYLLKDMGRTLTVYDPDLSGDLHIATYHECQIVAGSASEGVIDNMIVPNFAATYYVRVWAANGSSVVVARVG